MAAFERTWIHTLCEACWFKRQPNRFPTSLIREPGDLVVDLCCLCGTTKITRIFVRIDPASDELFCGGRHEARGTDE